MVRRRAVVGCGVFGASRRLLRLPRRRDRRFRRWRWAFWKACRLPGMRRGSHFGRPTNGRDGPIALVSGCRQEVDRKEDRHDRDVFRAKIESGDSVHDLVGQHRRIHVGGLQLTQRDTAVGFDR